MIYALLFLIFPQFDADCYYLLYNNGLKAHQERHFHTALQKFKAARGCPDKPANSDLEDWIRKADAALEEQTIWQRARRADNPDAYQRYLNRYPGGYYRRRAEEALGRAQHALRKPLTDTLPQGRLHWTEEYVEAEGQSVVNREKYKNEAQALAMATRGAEVVAKANLLELVQGLQIRRRTTVKDLMAESDLITGYLEGVVRGARRIGEPKEVNGMVSVVMRMPLYGAAPAPSPQDRSDSSAAPLMLRLPQGASPVLFPTLVREDGTLLLDGLAFHRQYPEGPLVRYLSPESGNDRAWPITEDTQGRWVLPPEAAQMLQQLLDIQNKGGEVGPITCFRGTP